jgi:genome maintenance exonuclease 1
MGVKSIIDFKTSRKRKEEKWISNYFMQEAAYAVMFEERTKIPIVQLVTIIATEEQEPQIFIQHRDDWIDRFMVVRNQYDVMKQTAND